MLTLQMKQKSLYTQLFERLPGLGIVEQLGLVRGLVAGDGLVAVLLVPFPHRSGGTSELVISA